MGIAVNPDILVQARQTAGFDVDEAAHKLGLHDSALSSAKEKLEVLEAGEKQPTQTQLATCARVYKRPLATFYLAKPGSGGRIFGKRRTPAEPVKTGCWTRFCGM
ncbi:MAG: helix-turn-helix transcriptional regulator [Rhodobacteraceae bacterium]|nr:helix-turn-helix transcriptional regulator [Paracoccaceae bacterium]